MNNQLIVLTCLCAIISYSPQIISEWWHVHCLWGLVSFWFLCDLFVVGSDLKHANDRIKDLMTNREALDTKLKFAEIMKRINENEFLLLKFDQGSLLFKNEAWIILVIMQAHLRPAQYD